MLLGLFVYGIAKRAARGVAARRRACMRLVRRWARSRRSLLLWFYQWQAFGHPFYPGQHWMPPVEWIELGYQGVGGPQPELLLALRLRSPIRVCSCSAPLLLLALAAPFVDRGAARAGFPALELAALCSAFVGLALWLFFSGVNYTRLQFNTGIRYLAPTFPFLFVPAAVVLMRSAALRVSLLSVVAAVAQAWCLAMYRDVERGSLGVLEPVLQTFLGGFQLPALTTLSRLGGPLGSVFPDGVSPLPLFVLTAAIVYGIWRWPPATALLRTPPQPPAPRSPSA